MSVSLKGSEAKLAWAGKHFDLLNAGISNFRKWFREVKPYSIVSEVDPKTGEYVYYLSLPEPVPDPQLMENWGLVLGDVVHNIRSALDQAIYALTCDFSKGPLPKTEFPVFGNPIDFKKLTKKLDPAPQSGLFDIRGIDPTLQDLIESFQPYHRVPDKERHHLFVLQELWNEDKHRIIPTVGGVHSIEGLSIGGPGITYIRYLSTSNFVFKGDLRDGAEIGRAKLVSTNPDEQVKVDLVAEIAFEKSGPGLGESVTELLYECLCAAVGIVSVLEAS